MEQQGSATPYEGPHRMIWPPEHAAWHEEKASSISSAHRSEEEAVCSFLRSHVIVAVL